MINSGGDQGNEVLECVYFLKAYSNISTLRAESKSCRFACQICRIRVCKEKVTDSKISGNMKLGPKL